MNEENPTEQLNDEINRISFSGRTEYIPGLILEQSLHIRALLGTIFTLQIELLAHLTQSDLDATRDDYVGKLRELTLEYANEAKASVESQPPLD